jgi:hypothetical protein
LAVDTVKLGMTAKALRQPEDTAVRNQFRFGKAGALVRVTGPLENPAPLGFGLRDPLVPLSVEVSAPGAKPKLVFGGANAAMLQPSPDGKLLAVRCLANKESSDLKERFQVDRDRLFVLDAHGEVLADIDTYKE